MSKIHVPTIWIPRWCDIGIEVGIGLRGELTWELIETRRFRRPVVVRRGKQSNLIVDAGLDGWLALPSPRGPLGWAPMYMAVGTGTTAPTATQTSLQAQLTQVAADYAIPGYDVTVYPPYVWNSATFNENVANGDLTEWGVKMDTTLWCRELFRDELGTPVVVTKTNTQVLRLTYRLYMQRAVDSVTTQLVAAGITYTCVTTINNAQIAVLLQNGMWGNGARVGTSNAPSDLINDAADAIKGTQLFRGSLDSSFTTTYVAGTFQREKGGSLTATQANGSIGEIVSAQGSGAATIETPSCRTTFDPVIVKDTSKKLKFGVTFTASRVAA